LVIKNKEGKWLTPFYLPEKRCMYVYLSNGMIKLKQLNCAADS